MGLNSRLSIPSADRFSFSCLSSGMTQSLYFFLSERQFIIRLLNIKTIIIKIEASAVDVLIDRKPVEELQSLQPYPHGKRRDMHHLRHGCDLLPGICIDRAVSVHGQEFSSRDLLIYFLQFVRREQQYSGKIVGLRFLVVEPLLQLFRGIISFRIELGMKV